MIPLKTAAIEDALDRVTIRLEIYTLIANLNIYSLNIIDATAGTVHNIFAFILHVV